MKILIISLALGVFPACAGSRDVPIRLYSAFQVEPPPAVLESIHEEVDGIMSEVGLNLEWRSLAANRGNEASVELVVVRFNGQCEVDDLRPTDGYPGPLGWTHVSDGRVTPFIGINCDGIRIFLQQDLCKLPESARAASYGRAVARVLAHELYHVFSRTTKHGSSGIAKAAYTIGELLSDNFRFNKKQSDVLSSHAADLVMAGASFQAGN
jgi:hypothetical protein